MNLRRAPMLMYHSIGTLENDPNMLSTSPQRFRAHMRYLKSRKLRGVSMREMVRAANSGTTNGLVGLTFDDGYEDFLHTAMPVLEEYGFSATVFVVTGLLGGENDWEHMYSPRPPLKLLGAEGLREVVARGMEVGSHTVSHANLVGLEPEHLEEEVGASRRVLGEVLGETVEGFCYPYGSYDGAAVQAARRAGYTYACGWKTRIEGSVYDLPRIPMAQRDGFVRFAAKLAIYSHYVAISRNLR